MWRGKARIPSSARREEERVEKRQIRNPHPNHPPVVVEWHSGGVGRQFRKGLVLKPSWPLRFPREWRLHSGVQTFTPRRAFLRFEYNSTRTRGCLNWKGRSEGSRTKPIRWKGRSLRNYHSTFSESARPGASWRSPLLSAMLKRRASAPKTGRKKKKGNATYTLTSLDSSDDEKAVVEDVRVWDISTSERTGRMTASRKTLKHYSQVSPSEEPSASKEPRSVHGVASAEDPGSLADSESPPEMAGKGRPKRKRVRAIKENDSVSKSLAPRFFEFTPVFRRRWSIGGVATVWSFSTKYSATMAWVTRLTVLNAVSTARTNEPSSNVETVLMGWCAVQRVSSRSTENPRSTESRCVRNLTPCCHELTSSQAMEWWLF